ncbi:MAG: family 16 glycoside hydrolase [Gemmatimonadaceae bacterium]
MTICQSLFQKLPLRMPLVCVALIAFAQSTSAQASPKSGNVAHDAAREATLLSQVKIPDGFKVTMFAAPPAAMYPVCLTGTVQGAVFVCVDPNLSLTAAKGKGRVMRLVDTNGDGTADTYSVFAEMDSPRGLAYDGKTLYVMHPPTLTAYRDTTGDGIADLQEDLVTGLGFDLNFRGADHTTNGITLGIDGWIYIAVGDYGYRKAVGKDGTSISHRGGSVVRVRTDGSGLEIYAQGTRNMYDLAIDPMMHVFSRDNTNDGDGWDTRLHYLPPGANMGYPVLYKNFANEHMKSLADYGSGSGTGGLWVHDPNFPDGFGNTLYTSDWLTNHVTRHPLTAKGASYEIKQEEFVTIPHPVDMAMDGQSNMFIASLAGGSFTYDGDTIGFVVRVSPVKGAASRPLNVASLNDVQLRVELISPNSEHRLQAQHELLRRGEKAGVVSALNTIVLDKKQQPYARVAAMFTLKQLIGERANKTLIAAASDPAVKALALRALVDNTKQFAGVDAKLYVQNLADTSASVQLSAIAGLVRLNAKSSAASIVPMTASADAAVAHIAVNALVSLQASTEALAGLNSSQPAIRAGSLRALQLMHEPSVVTGLIAANNAAPAKHDVVFSLARLYNREGDWAGDWWGTRPSFIGPYFAPVTWEASAQIKPILQNALMIANGADLALITDEFIRNRILPQGAKSLVLANENANDRKTVIDALVGTSQIAAVSIPILLQLDKRNAANHAAVAALLAAETGIVDGELPLLRSAILDPTMGDTVRGKLLGIVSAISGRPGLDATTRLLSQLTPAITPAGTPANALEAAWRRFVGDRRRLNELDYFIDLTRGATSETRALGFSVLLQSVRGNRGPATVNDKVKPVLASAWNSREASGDLVRAVHIMRLESGYTDELTAYQTSKPPQTGATRSPNSANMDWKQMFNGKDLSDWDLKFAGSPMGVNYRNTVRVEDGLLKVRYDQWKDFSGEFGHIFYKQPYSYYIVAAEYRFVGDQVVGAGAGNSWAIRNNGIMIHSQSAASMGLKQDFPISMEVQILGGLGNGTRTNGNVCTPGTNLVMNDKLITAHCINSTSVTYDGDGWVRLEAMVLGDSVVKHIVNGDTVLVYNKPQMGGGNANNTNPGVLINGKLLNEGYIVLQAESAPIDFRKVEIVNLKGCMDPKDANYRSYFVKSDPTACRKH